MLSWFIGRKLDAFERAYAYDMSYAREILAESPKALLTWLRATQLTTWHEGVPKDVWYAARLTVLLEEDCGPCTQLLVTMAERDGVDPFILQALIERRYGALDEGLAIAARFGAAVARAEPEAAALRERLVELYGRRTLIALGFGIVASRLYPTLKRALGYDRECRRVVIAGKGVAPGRRPAHVGLAHAAHA